MSKHILRVDPDRNRIAANTHARALYSFGDAAPLPCAMLNCSYRWLTRAKENLAELFGAGPGSRGGKGTVSPGRMDHMRRRAVKEMEANAKVASAASGVAQQVREAKVMKEMQGLEITDEDIMDTSAANDSIRYGGVVPSSPSHWEVRV